MTSKLKVGIIVGSTRPGRKAPAVAEWVRGLAATRSDLECEVVDIETFSLPLLDEPIPASQGKYEKAHTLAWAAKVATFDAYVFVTPEYNHATSGALKNAIDFVYAEWNDKAAGFVSYGSAGGVRAVENLRLVMGELQVADVRTQVTLSLYTDFENFSAFKPDPKHERSVTTMLDQLTSWGRALRGVRHETPKP